MASGKYSLKPDFDGSPRNYGHGNPSFISSTPNVGNDTHDTQMVQQETTFGPKDGTTDVAIDPPLEKRPQEDKNQPDGNETNTEEKYPTMTQDEFDDLPAPAHPNCLARATKNIIDLINRCVRGQGRIIKYIVCITLAIAYFCYFGYAMHVERLKNPESIRLLWMTCAVTFFVIVYFLKRCCQSSFDECWETGIVERWRSLNESTNNKLNRIFVGIFAVITLIGVILILIFLVAMKDTYNLVSLAGIATILIIGYVGSKHPDRVNWRPVLLGILLQFVFALLILKTKPGYDVFKFIGDRVTEFLKHTDVGSKFVFNVHIPKALDLNNFAFRVLPIIIFFSAAISILYYIGLMQMVIEKVSWVMQVTMGTTAGESLNAAGNIFVGMTESPLIIRPFLGRMTNSELHAVMTGGFATIAGSVLGAYILFGVPANHLISASVMSAPAALAVSKLFYPETKKSVNTARDAAKMEKSPYKNLIEAATGGALTSIRLVANIGASLIAFLAILEFINQTLTWFGSRAGMTQDLTLQFICSYLLWPLSLVMGVEIPDCGRVAELIGVKTFLNEFIAYQQLGNYIKNRNKFLNLTRIFNVTNPKIVKSGLDFIVPEFNDTFFEKGFLTSPRSELIATYSLCGFANIGSIGILLGGLSGMAPHRTKDMAAIITRAMIAGNLACFLTACVAGLFYDPSV